MYFCLFLSLWYFEPKADAVPRYKKHPLCNVAHSLTNIKFKASFFNIRSIINAKLVYYWVNIRNTSTFTPGLILSWIILGLMLKLQYFGHLMRTANSSGKTLILGKIDGQAESQRTWPMWEMVQALLLSWHILMLWPLQDLQQ